MLYTDYLIYGIAGISIFLFVLIIVLIIALLRNRSVLAQDVEQYMPERCATCGQILEPGWNRCPFCMEEIRAARAYPNYPKGPDVRGILPVGFFIAKTGPDRGKSYKIDNHPLFIGSGNQNDIIINDNKVSPRHSKIWLANNIFIIQDLHSQEGTRVNSKIIDQTELYDNDLIEIANNFFVFKILD